MHIAIFAIVSVKKLLKERFRPVIIGDAGKGLSHNLLRIDRAIGHHHNIQLRDAWRKHNGNKACNGVDTGRLVSDRSNDE